MTLSSSTLGRSTSSSTLAAVLRRQGYDTAGYGSIWTYDTPTGTVVRWNGQTHQNDPPTSAVTDPPFYGGLCLTSIAAGAGAVWVTVAANVNYGC